MNKKVLFGGIGCFLLVCCAIGVGVAVTAGVFVNKSETGKDFNNAIITENNEFQKDLTALSDAFGSSTSTEDEVDTLRLDLIDQAETSIEVIEDLKTPDGGEDLKAIGIEIFTYYKGLLETDYAEAIDLQFSPDYSTADYQRILEIAGEITEKETDFTTRLRDIQKDFSEEYNFRIEGIE